MTFTIIGLIVFAVAGIGSKLLSEFDRFGAALASFAVAVVGLLLGAGPWLLPHAGYVDHEPTVETVSLVSFDGAYHVDKDSGFVFYKDLGNGKIEQLNYSLWYYSSVDLQADAPGKAYLEIVSTKWSNFWGNSGDRKIVKAHLPKSALGEIAQSSVEDSAK